jgi:hypothetical protein
MILLLLLLIALNLPTTITQSQIPVGSLHGHFTLSELNTWLNKTREKYPTLIKSTIIGKSIQGRPIESWCVGEPCFMVDGSHHPNNNNQGEIFFSALHHAREPLGMMSLVYFIDDVLHVHDVSDDPSISMGTKRHLLKTRRMEFVLVVNPDGYVANEQGDGMRRKNLRDTGKCSGLDKEIGVDLNRNYDFCFNRDSIGASNLPCEIDYQGPHAFSEPETIAIRKFVESRKFTVAFNYHSFGKQLYIPFSCKPEGKTKEEDYFRRLAKRFTVANKFHYGQPWNTNLYSVNGDASDWFYSAHGIYAFSPEVSPADPVASEHDGFWVQVNMVPGWSKENDDMNYKGSWSSGPCLETTAEKIKVENNDMILTFTLINEGVGKIPLLTSDEESDWIDHIKKTSMESKSSIIGKSGILFSAAISTTQISTTLDGTNKKFDLCQIQFESSTSSIELKPKAQSQVVGNIHCNNNNDNNNNNNNEGNKNKFIILTVLDHVTCSVFEYSITSTSSSTPIQINKLPGPRYVSISDLECLLLRMNITTSTSTHSGDGGDGLIPDDFEDTSPPTSMGNKPDGSRKSNMIGLAILIGSLLIVICIVGLRRYWVYHQRQQEFGLQSFEPLPTVDVDI